MKYLNFLSILLPAALLLGVKPASAQNKAVIPATDNIGSMKVQTLHQGTVTSSSTIGSEWIDLTGFVMSTGDAKSHTPIVVTKAVDAASAKLLQLVNQSLPTVMIQLTRKTSNGKTAVYQTIRLTDAVITKIKQSSSNNSPREEISLDYRIVQVEDAK
jgi:type VI secretion system Hcp family effector